MGKLYENVLRNAAFLLPAEAAHDLGLKTLRAALSSAALRSVAAKKYRVELPVERFGLRFPNPIGVAAGFDKNGVAVEQLAALGFGCVEVGTVTLRPQSGNERPRMFRLPADQALINRLGFNNEGAHAVAKNISRIKQRDCIIGVNIGKNRDVAIEDAARDYVAVLEIVHSAADYISVNISSPNTPNLRELQLAENFEPLISRLVEKNALLGKKPLFVKISPDLPMGGAAAIGEACLRIGVDGVIATNTTLSRDGLTSPSEATSVSGGLSGRPLDARSNAVIRELYTATGGRLPIIGVGGVFDAGDAFEKFMSGASLIQAYTGFVYRGPSFAASVLSGLVKILRDTGFSSLDEAVGTVRPGAGNIDTP